MQAKGREKIMDAHWFDKARYGMFIHWGLYALMGGVYQGQEVPYGAEWIMKNARIPHEEYRRLMERFTAENFDADEIVRNAKRWGMEYLVFTAKHHDGFCMYHSKVSDYNIANTPFGQDVVKELAEACQKHGIVFCTYYSQMQDWADPNGWGNDWDFGPDREKDFEKYFRDKVKPQVKELLTGYGPIGMMWFDTPYTMPKELCLELRDYVKELQPDCLVSGRVGYGLGDFREIPDNETPVLSFHKPWETPTTMNNTWGYSERDHEWKSAETIQHKLVTIVQKGGHLLLNIGPDGTGAVPEGSSKVLEEVGAWMQKNGESIYACEAVPDYSYQLRFGQITLHGQTLYLHVFNYPRFPHEIIVVDMPVKVKSVQLLTTGEPLRFIQSYEIARNEYRFRVILPETCPDPIDTVVKVELEGPLCFQPLQ